MGFEITVRVEILCFIFVFLYKDYYFMKHINRISTKILLFNNWRTVKNKLNLS